MTEYLVDQLPGQTGEAYNMNTSHISWPFILANAGLCLMAGGAYKCILAKEKAKGKKITLRDKLSLGGSLAFATLVASKVLHGTGTWLLHSSNLYNALSSKCTTAKDSVKQSLGYLFAPGRKNGKVSDWEDTSTLWWADPEQARKIRAAIQSRKNYLDAKETFKDHPEFSKYIGPAAFNLYADGEGSDRGRFRISYDHNGVFFPKVRLAPQYNPGYDGMCVPSGNITIAPQAFDRSLVSAIHTYVHELGHRDNFTRGRTITDKGDFSSVPYLESYAESNALDYALNAPSSIRKALLKAYVGNSGYLDYNAQQHELSGGKPYQPTDSFGQKQRDAYNSFDYKKLRQNLLDYAKEYVQEAYRVFI